MIPRRSRFGFLTRRGRLRNHWAAVFAEHNPRLALDRLRGVLAEFDRRPTSFHDLWPAFLASLFGSRLLWVLTPAELALLERTGLRMSGLPHPGPSVERSCGPIVAAHDTRREPQAAAALLARLYAAPATTNAEKTAIARTLAARGARGDQHLAVYTDHLRRVGGPAAEPAMVTLLTDCLTVGFGLPALRVRRAAELAGALRRAGVALPGIDLATGYWYLQINRQREAVAHLETAYATKPDATALAGLLSALLRGCDDERIAALAAAPGPGSPLIGALFTLSATLAWLEDPMADGPIPATAAWLAGAGLGEAAGEWLWFAVGRLYLLEGDAHAAARILVPLADAHPERPHWHYHAAWTQLLLGDRHGVRRQFDATGDWPERWTLGCLLMDADPSSADLVVEHLGRSEARGALAVRLALARHRKPPSFGWDPADGTAEEALESLRAMLGHRLAGRTPLPLDDAPARPMLRHLPFAEQLMWSALACLPTDRGRGRALLEQAAHTHGHPRAGLVLAVHHLEEGRHGEARILLDRFAWRTDPAMAVLRAWATARTGDEEAKARLEDLAARGDSRAHYALGSVYLGLSTRSTVGATPSAERATLFAGQAAAEFRAARADPERMVPSDAAILEFCAGLAAAEADPTEGAGSWAALERLPVARRPPWVTWAVALAELAGDPAVADPAAAEQLVSLLEDGDTPAPPTVRAVAAGLSRASLAAAGDTARAGVFTVLIGRTAGLVPDPETTRLHETALAATARRTGVASSSKSAPMLLVGAERALARGDTAEASRLLRSVAAEEQPAHRIGLLVADVLDGRSPAQDAAEARAEPPERTPRAVLALLAAQAAAQAEQDSARSVAILAPVLGDRDLTRVVDVHKSLPLLCAEAAKLRKVPEWLTDLVRAAAQNGGHGLDQLTLARCAAVTGDEKLASGVWRRLFDEERPPDTGGKEIADEYLRLLTHQAARARLAGAWLEAARDLRLATLVPDGRRPLATVVAEAELKKFHRSFLHAVKGLRAGLRDEAKTRWYAYMRALNEALRAGDEVRALVFRARLDDLLATVRQKPS